jgi:hypothetical protein
VKYQWRKEQEKMGIGSLADVSLKNARKKAEDIRLRVNGKNGGKVSMPTYFEMRSRARHKGLSICIPKHRMTVRPSYQQSQHGAAEIGCN